MGSPKGALSPGRGSPRTPTKSPLGRNAFTPDHPSEELDLSSELLERVSRMTSAAPSSQGSSAAGTPTRAANHQLVQEGLKRTRSERLGYLVSEGLARFSEVVTDGPFPGVVVLGLAVALGVEWLRRMPIFPVFAVCYIIWGIAQKRTKEQVQKARRQWELEMAETKAETVLESVDWLNCLLRILWRNVYEPKFALQLCNVLQKKLSKSRPKFMQTLEFTHFALGTAPPVFGPAKIVRHMGDQALDIDFAFHSEHPEVVIQSRMQLGTLFYVPGSFSSTIKVTSLKISGKLRVRPFPAERVLLVSFTGEPKMHIDISLWGISMKALQPILTWLTSELKTAIAKQWVEPRRFCLELRAGALPHKVKKAIKAQGGMMKVAVLQVRLFDGPATGAHAGAQNPAEIHLVMKVRGVKARSKLVLSRREGGGTIYTSGGTPLEQEFKLPGNTGVATLVCSSAADFNLRPALGACSVQHKWMHDGGTCYWHNGKENKPLATRTFEPYTAWVPLRDAAGAEVGEACIWSSASWFYGVPETAAVERTIASTSATGSTDRDKIVHEALSSRDGFWIITLVEARNLVAKDSNGKSDPYCKLRVGHKKKLSKVKSKTLSPRWNETFSFSQGSRLVLTCMDKDFLGFDNDFLGIIDLDLVQFKDGVTHDIWLPLQATESGEVHLRIIFEKRHDTNSASGWSPLKSLRWTASPTLPGEMHASRISIVPSGGSPDLLDTPEYSPGEDGRESEDGRGDPRGDPSEADVPAPPLSPGAEATWRDAEVLVVTLVEASNLIIRDFIMKKSDPFCKLKLGKLSRKSSVKSGNLNPIWNEAFEFIIAEGKLDPDEPLLRIECRDKDFFSTDFLGAAHIDLRDLRPGVTEDMWMTLAGVKHGRIHVRLLLRPPLDNAATKRFDHPIQRFESRTSSQSSLRDSDQEA